MQNTCLCVLVVYLFLPSFNVMFRKVLRHIFNRSCRGEPRVFVELYAIFRVILISVIIFFPFLSAVAFRTEQQSGVHIFTLNGNQLGTIEVKQLQ